MKVKTSELTDHTLDWAVGFARCMEVTEGKPVLSRDMMAKALKNGMVSPSTNWSQGGPIIERESIRITPFPPGREREGWSAGIYDRAVAHPGPTPLIAAMRCYVASKLGEEIDVPEELR